MYLLLNFQKNSWNYFPLIIFFLIVAARRLSEAGVNRRPSAAMVLTEDTSSFIVGDRVYVDGIKPGRIQYIGMLYVLFSSNHNIHKSSCHLFLGFRPFNWKILVKSID